VLSPDYDAHLAQLRQTTPATCRDIERRLSMEYKEVFRMVDYRVLRRATAGSGTTP
jgi:hypothetical protein